MRLFFGLLFVYALAMAVPARALTMGDPGSPPVDAVTGKVPTNDLAAYGFYKAGNEALDKRDWDKALDQYHRATTQKPGNASAWPLASWILYNSADANIAKGNLAQAMNDLGYAILLKPDFADAFALRGAIFATGGPTNKANTAAEFKRAIELYTLALTAHPGDTAILMKRGELYAIQDQYGRAFDDFEAVQASDPMNADGWSGRATLYARRGKLHESESDLRHAVDDFTKAIAIHPSAAMFMARGNVEYGQKNYDASAADIDQSLSLDPDNAMALNQRCWLRAEMNKELDAALTDCEKAVRLAPRSSAVQDSIAFVFFRLGQFDRALVAYDKALASRGENASSLYMRGMVKLRLGRADGVADIAAAKLIDGRIAKTYAARGVAPP